MDYSYIPKNTFITSYYGIVNHNEIPFISIKMATVKKTQRNKHPENTMPSANVNVTQSESMRFL